MRCQKCGSSYIGRTFTYSGTFIVTRSGEQISDNLIPVPSGRYWRCLECNALVQKITEEEL